MTLIACPACHALNPADYRFCENCGGILAESVTPRNVAPESSAEVPPALETPQDDEHSTDQAVMVAPQTAPNTNGASPGASNAEESTVLDFKPSNAPNFTQTVELDHLLLSHLECAAASSVGRTRGHNEDHFWFGLQQLRQCGYEDPETVTYRGAFILCDGMGGHDGGEIASALATKTLKQQLSYFWASGLPDHETFQEYIHHANQVIWEQNQQQNRHRMGRMGTTLVMLLVDGKDVAVGHVGDSRLYCVTTDLDTNSNANPDTNPDTNPDADSSDGNLDVGFLESEMITAPDHPLADLPPASDTVEEIPEANSQEGAEVVEASGSSVPELTLDSIAPEVQGADFAMQEAAMAFSDLSSAPDGAIDYQDLLSEATDYAPQALLEQLTEDHEVANQLIARGLDPAVAYGRPDAHQLTQALGPNIKIEPTISYFTLSQNTLFLLCSDGLCDNDVVEQYWQEYLLPLCHRSADLNQGVRNLIDFADRVNGHDNITALLVKCSLTEQSLNFNE
jgi:serine/threonine protein phosphatase PrpC